MRFGFLKRSAALDEAERAEPGAATEPSLEREAGHGPPGDEPHATTADAGTGGVAAPGPDATPDATPDDSVPEPAEANEPRRSKGNRVVALAILIGIAISAFVTGLLVFNNMVMPSFIHGAGEVRVPDLMNLTIEQAEKIALPMGLQVSRAGERFDPAVPRGFIVSQDPIPETPVRGKKRVMVVVSLGEEFSSVPSLFGESLRSARLLLQRSGLRVSGITQAASDEVGEGLVAGTDPPAETVLPRNSTVSLLLSSGTGKESYVMPDLLGREITGVRRHLESLGFRVITPPAAPSIGSITYQDPPAGSHITVNTMITLQASGRMIR